MRDVWVMGENERENLEETRMKKWDKEENLDESSPQRC